MSVYCRLFRGCAKNKLKFWECPEALFLLMGILTIGIMAGTYFIINIYASPETVITSISATAALMLIIGSLVSKTVNRINLAKQQVETEKRKTESIVMNLTDGLILLSSDCKIIFANPRACEFFDINNNKNISLKYIQENDLLEKYPKLKKVFSWCPTYESFLKTKVIIEIISFGKPKQHFKVYTTPVMDGAKNFLGYIKIFHDITREKELDQMKSEFISLTSHQLRGPLSGTKWLTELLLGEKSGKLNEEQKKYLSEILKGNERMIRLVSELLDVARIEEGRMELKLQKADINKLIFEIIKLSQVQAAHKKVNLSFLPLSGNFEIIIDVDKIKMAFQNLIENAIKYTKLGGSVKIKIKEQSNNSILGLLSNNFNSYQLKVKNYILVSVCDTGMGISEEDRKKIFSKFYRGKRAKAVEAQGTGLGLYICKQIIEKHNGLIWFSDGAGKGTIFYVAIPALKMINN